MSTACAGEEREREAQIENADEQKSNNGGNPETPAAPVAAARDEQKSNNGGNAETPAAPVAAAGDEQKSNNGGNVETPAAPVAVAAAGEHGSVVADHYNKLEEKGLQERFNSPIFYMRNFNNWVKSVLINTYTDKLKERDFGRAIRALDICCGKGGDLIKWQKTRIKHLVCADIADVSVQQCNTRFTDMSARGPQPFTAEFITADCTKERLREKYADPSLMFDLVSCQFGFHYCFESLPQAECMLRNVSECLRPGGYFIGTIPDAYEIVSRCNRSIDLSFGNKIFNIKLLFDPKSGYPLFGAKYDFHLEGVVDCPEFLVNFALFVKLAAKFGLQLEHKEKFNKFFESNRERYSHLLGRIKCFESYPAAAGTALLAEEADYSHAQRHLSESAQDRRENRTVGTMSRPEWEAATIYMVFAFKKSKSTLDANGKPVYQVTGRKRTHSQSEQNQ